MRISYGPGIKGLTSLLSFDDCTNHPNLCQDKGKVSFLPCFPRCNVSKITVGVETLAFGEGLR